MSNLIRIGRRISKKFKIKPCIKFIYCFQLGLLKYWRLVQICAEIIFLLLCYVEMQQLFFIVPCSRQRNLEICKWSWSPLRVWQQTCVLYAESLLFSVAINRSILYNAPIFLIAQWHLTIASLRRSAQVHVIRFNWKAVVAYFASVSRPDHHNGAVLHQFALLARNRLIRLT